MSVAGTSLFSVNDRVSSKRFHVKKTSSNMFQINLKVVIRKKKKIINLIFQTMMKLAVLLKNNRLKAKKNCQLYCHCVKPKKLTSSNRSKVSSHWFSIISGHFGDWQMFRSLSVVDHVAIVPNLWIFMHLYHHHSKLFSKLRKSTSQMSRNMVHNDKY